MFSADRYSKMSLRLNLLGSLLRVATESPRAAQVPLDSVQAAPNRCRSFRPAENGSACVRPGKNPVKVRIVGGIQLGKRMAGPRENAFGDAALHVAKEARVAPQRAHDDAGEEDGESETASARCPRFRRKIAGAAARSRGSSSRATVSRR